MNQGNRKIRFGLWYDFRNPSQWRQPYDRLYGETLDQIAWGESQGFDDVWLSEHHFIEDGYLPSILPVAAAIAARTKRIRIASGVLLVPFHNPVRLAEDIAVVDVISGGRFELGVGVGFKLEEFDSFGVSFRERGSRTNQSLDIIRRLLSGETVTYKSDFFNFKNIKVTPEPIQKPHPPIWLGGFTAAALRRAARYGDGFTVPGATRDVYDQYVAQLKKQNRPARTFDWQAPFGASSYPTILRRPSPKPPTISSIRRIITQHGFLRRDSVHFPSICAIGNSCAKAGCSRWSTPTRR